MSNENILLLYFSQNQCHLLNRHEQAQDQRDGYACSCKTPLLPTWSRNGQRTFTIIMPNKWLPTILCLEYCQERQPTCVCFFSFKSLVDSHTIVYDDQHEWETPDPCRKLKAASLNRIFHKLNTCMFFFY